MGNLNLNQIPHLVTVTHILFQIPVDALLQVLDARGQVAAFQKQVVHRDEGCPVSQSLKIKIIALVYILGNLMLPAVERKLSRHLLKALPLSDARLLLVDGLPEGLADQERILA